ncbi:DUF3253 domain-containing protein [Arthrobacter sp. H35-D1]|uniref:DUF3253 domain-containing protein n=1 Tax=Arthrobacter sp. H35-D1 TaxID=3046202 RepID=UPI0024B9CB4F|nr:DUF3253 domain-containing protein [Arthrobacter sp. H35-D1]MDJ0315226.1 DUF3253 domain-containing protein [Arthrobacter sp. H35-D1]
MVATDATSIKEGSFVSTEKTVEPTADGHYLVIDGRKWRASDPSIPDTLRQELVDELMSARRAVKNRENDARIRVNDAKVALGERGQPWWEKHEPQAFNERIMATIGALLRKRAGSSICPSEVARVVGGKGESWRQYMDDIRQVAAEMASQGELIATQKGVAVEPNNARGPIRLLLPPRPAQ